MPDNRRNYGKWTGEELRKAEATASQFLEEHSSAIADTMRSKTRVLENLIERISRPTTPFGDRLEYLARISEITKLLQADADGFFELASQPMVARILATVPRAK